MAFPHTAFPQMATARFLVFTSLALSMGLVGCLSKIGDDCVTDQDCSPQLDRLCDTTQPYGYCTLANCDPTSCPEKESVCVAFNNTRSSVGLCDDPGQPSPHRRTFCMATCGTSSQCRSGYACIDLAKDDSFSAEIIERYPESTRVCMVAESVPEIEKDREDGYCSAGLGGATSE